MPLIDFPNVPDVPGVPAIARSITVATSVTSLIGLAQEVFSDFLGSRWGVFDDSGTRVLFPDSFLGIEFKNDERQSDYPVEGGGFQTYNKVDTPYDVRVKMAVGGDEISRTEFLRQCDVMLHGIDLYTVITPEVSFATASLVNLMYKRETKNGATMLTVDLWFEEVRESATLLTAAAQPSGADAISDGTVQAFPVDTSNPVQTHGLPPSALGTMQ